MAKYSFELSKDKKLSEWWIVTVNQEPGFELHFKYQQFNTSKKLILPEDTTLAREEAEDILNQMTSWLMKNYYGILTIDAMDYRDLPMSRQFQLAMDESEMTVENVAECVGCKLSRIKHILTERYETINLKMFIDACESMGYGVALFKKDDMD